MLQMILDHLIELAFVLIAPSVSYFALAGAKWLARKAHIELQQAQNQQIEDIITQALHYVEEQSHKAVKAGVDTMADADKRKLAVELIGVWLQAAALPAIPAEHLEKRVEASLNAAR